MHALRFAVREEQRGAGHRRANGCHRLQAKTKLPFVQRYISARPGETLRIGEWDRELQSIASLPTVTRATWRPAPSFAAPDDAAAASPSGAEGDVAAAAASTGTPAPAATAAGQAAGGRGRPAAANAAEPPTASAGAPSVPSGLEGPQAAAAAAAVASGADSRLDLEVLIEEPKKFWNSSFQLGATAVRSCAHVRLLNRCWALFWHACSVLPLSSTTSPCWVMFG